MRGVGGGGGAGITRTAAMTVTVYRAARWGSALAARGMPIGFKEVCPRA